MSKHSTLIVAILIAALLVIGFVVSGSGSKSEQKADNSGNTGAKDTATAKENKENTAVLEAIIAADPGEKATAAQLKVYYDLVAGKAKDASALGISQCVGNPPVMKVTAKKNFTIANADAKAHVIEHPQFKFEVAANSQTKDAQVKEVGIYGYACYGKNGGYLFVTP